MKKLFIPMISLISITSLSGCKSSAALQIACPSGAPALALYDIYNEGNVEINTDANNVAAYLSANSEKDIVIAPTNLLVGKVMKGNAPFKLAAVITAGNFFIASTGKDDNNTFDTDDYIVLFQKDGLPDKLFQYTYGEYSNLKYVTAASDAAKCLISGKNEADDNADVDYVLVPQPALTPALAKAKQNRPDMADNIRVVKNVQNDYYAKTGDAKITQASIFVKNTDDENKKKQIDEFLASTQSKINGLLEDENKLDVLSNLEDTDLASKFGAPNLTILKKVVKENSLNLTFKNGKEEKGAIDKFLKNLKFTNEDTSEDLYY